MGGLMYMFIRKYTKVRSVADAARRAKSGIGQILRESNGFRSYYVLDGGEGVGVAREAGSLGPVHGPHWSSVTVRVATASPAVTRTT